MEQHPIPQNISSYEFRLVGDMTLKQFLQLAGGILAGVIIYRLPLPAFVRYPLVFGCVVLGITLAFVPINGRPFIRYVWAFLFAIYAPTEFTWRHTDKVTPTAIAPSAVAPPSPAGRDEVGPQPESLQVVSTVPIVAPALEIESSPQSTQTTASIYTAATPETPTTSPTPSSPVDIGPAISAEPESAPLPQALYTAAADASTETIPTPLPEPAASHIATTNSAVPTNLIIRPEAPNLLTGVVTTTEGNPIENVIVEIIEASSGIPARALRTNRLGQFQIATPLNPGAYTLQAEKTGLEFAPVRIEANNSIIEPVLLTPIA